jgi:hypothetical protein
MVEAAAAECPRIDLEDAYAITILIRDKDPDRYSRAAARWAARVCLERRLDLSALVEVIAQLRDLDAPRGHARVDVPGDRRPYVA